MIDTLFWLFALTLVVAMAWDVAKLEIPDTASLVLIAGFLVGTAWSGGWVAAGWNLLAGIAVFAAGLALFRMGIWGGGDVKLGAAIALWLGWGGLSPWLLSTAILGGALALTILFYRRVPEARVAGWPDWARRLHAPREGIPYGVALGAGALTVIDRVGVFVA